MVCGGRVVPAAGTDGEMVVVSRREDAPRVSSSALDGGWEIPRHPVASPFSSNGLVTSRDEGNERGAGYGPVEVVFSQHCWVSPRNRRVPLGDGRSVDVMNRASRSPTRTRGALEGWALS